MDKIPDNFGLLEERELNPKDYRVGGVSGVDRVVIREDGDYRDFLPEYESQVGIYFDAMDCVTRSGSNVIETLAKVMGLDWNRSDRFTAKMSGTTRRGNWLSKVADSMARLHGTIAEELWPFPNRQRTPIFDWDDYYVSIPEELKMKGKNWLRKWKIGHEWVPVDNLRHWMKYGALQVTVQAWPKPNAQGLYENRPSNKAYNHAVELIYVCDEYNEIYDSYDKMRKKLVPNYKFGHAKRFTIKRIDNNEETPMITLPNNCLVQMTGEGATGEFALHLEGKLLIDEVAKVLASYELRNTVELPDGSFEFQPKAKAITKEQWDSFPHFNLKLEPINQ